jgi:hypothetical protein
VAWSRQKVLVIGRHQLDLTNGWKGHPPASGHVVVVSYHFVWFAILNMAESIQQILKRRAQMSISPAVVRQKNRTL